MLTLRHALVRQHYGRALKIMMKQSEDKPTKELDGRMVEVGESLTLFISETVSSFFTAFSYFDVSLRCPSTFLVFLCVRAPCRLRGCKNRAHSVS